MTFFAVPSCSLKACLNWRIENKCVKDKMHIPTEIRFCANLHNSSICEVRRQINQYRLKQIVEE